MADISEHDHELLSRYLDGELSEQELALLRKRLASELSLNRHLKEMRALQSKIQAVYEDMARGDAPAPIRQMLEHPRTQAGALRSRRLTHWGYGLAASLIVAAGAVQISTQKHDVNDPDQLLSIALDDSESMASGWEALADGRKLRPVLSFQSTSGDWCREYMLADGDLRWHGVACRHDGTWSTDVVASVEPTDESAAYRPAGASTSEAVNNYISASAADIPLSLSEEAGLIARDWQ
ncbi:MAG: hypothetical protein AAGF57_07890 [Pseudomonadota bacterium]